MEKLQAFNSSYEDDSVILKDFQFKFGPLLIKGSNEFLVVFYNPNTQRSIARIISKPDCNNKNLIATAENRCDKCELSTFLENGDILLKVKHRFMIFNKNGDFIDQVTFSDIVQQSASQNSLEESKKATTNKSIPISNYSSKEYSDKMLEGGSRSVFQVVSPSPKRKKEHRDVDNEEAGIENLSNMAEKNDNELVTHKNRMRLIKISRRNSCFLFEDKLEMKFKIYELIKKCKCCDDDYNFEPSLVLGLRKISSGPDFP